MYNQMVMNDQQLNLTFGALADATRRGMLIQLSKGEASVSALAEPYEISQPAISKHIKVLERAGLVERRRQGREQFIRVKPEKARAAADWIAHYTKFWTAQFDDVEDYLKKANNQNRRKKK